MRGAFDLKAKTLHASKLDAGDDAAATIAIAAVADEYWVILNIHGSFDDTPSTVATLKIIIGGTTVWRTDILAKGLFSVRLPGGVYTGTVNEATNITLSAGGAGIAGKVNCSYK